MTSLGDKLEWTVNRVVGMVTSKHPVAAAADRGHIIRPARVSPDRGE
jgi:hypothetical protein